MLRCTFPFIKCLGSLRSFFLGFCCSAWFRSSQLVCVFGVLPCGFCFLPLLTFFRYYFFILVIWLPTILYSVCRRGRSSAERLVSPHPFFLTMLEQKTGATGAWPRGTAFLSNPEWDHRVLIFRGRGTTFLLRKLPPPNLVVVRIHIVLF